MHDPPHSFRKMVPSQKAATISQFLMLSSIALEMVGTEDCDDFTVLLCPWDTHFECVLHHVLYIIIERLRFPCFKPLVSNVKGD